MTVGTPLVAIENGGLINLNWHVRGDRRRPSAATADRLGSTPHLNAMPGHSDGSRVAAGQLVGYVGETGNAADRHLHLAHAPPSGQYVNP